MDVSKEQSSSSYLGKLKLVWFEVCIFSILGSLVALLSVEVNNNYQESLKEYKDALNAHQPEIQSVDMTHFCMDLKGFPALSDKKGYAWNFTYDSGIGTLEARLDVNGHAMRCMTREEFLAFFGSEESVLKLIDELNFYRWENE